jgi:hypothetical protein
MFFLLLDTQNTCPLITGATCNNGVVFERHNFKRIRMSQDQLDNLFREYETAFDQLDLKKISGYCADNLISAGPKGSIAQNRKEYEKKAEQAIKFYKSVGRNSARIMSKRIMPICNEYSMVVVRWGVTFEKTGSKPIEFDVSYIIQETEIDPKIILLISHEDEETAMKKLGLEPALKK